MPTLSPNEIARLVAPYLATAQIVPRGTISQPADPKLFHVEQFAPLYEKLSTYLDLLLRWNARTNLTAIRSPEEIVRRHFGESLFAALHVGSARTLLDFGSGAGFPGIPIQLLRSDLQVTLAESQGKKSAFLREAVRALDIPTEVWPRRVEDMPLAPSGEPRSFDVVALRAVDDMASALREAVARTSRRLLILGTEATALDPALRGLHLTTLPVPNTSAAYLLLAEKQ